LGECHYLDGNHKALSRSQAITIVIEDLGIDPQRFAIEWVSSAEASRFADVVTEFTEKIRTLGPNPVRQRIKTGTAA
jgi:F420-non-reducing hydrogenase iron-sulfur subunit